MEAVQGTRIKSIAGMVEGQTSIDWLSSGTRIGNTVGPPAGHSRARPAPCSEEFEWSPCEINGALCQRGVSCRVSLDVHAYYA
jgi:hypothetical protein